MALYKQGRINKEVYINYNKRYRKLIKIEQINAFNESLTKAGLNGKKMESNQDTLKP